MSLSFLIGILGSVTLVLGAAWPDKLGLNPAKSLKNWLFTFGNILMLAFSILGYLDGASIFFIFGEVLIAVSTVLMLLGVDDRIATPLIGLSTLGLVAWSLYLFEGHHTIYFILGLGALGIGYAFDNGTQRRSAALTVGSIFLTLFSLIEANWIFFWLNLFFALFSAFYLFKALLKR